MEGGGLTKELREEMDGRGRENKRQREARKKRMNEANSLQDVLL